MFLVRERHWLIHPRFSFFTMFIGNEILIGKFCTPSVLFRFFLNFFFIGSITLIITAFRFSVGNRHTIRISNLFRGFYTIFYFFFLGCSTYIISSLGILLNPIWMSFRI